MSIFDSIEPLYSVSGFGVGFLIGMTGMGGGSLMTPLLILLFGIQPATAVGTDLLFAAAGSIPATAAILVALSQLACAIRQLAQLIKSSDQASDWQSSIAGQDRSSASGLRKLAAATRYI